MKIRLIRNHRGFSLVEMMVVVALLSILALIGVPQFREYVPKYRVEAASKDLAAQMELYRVRSIANNVRHKLTFDDTAQKIIVETVNASGGVIASVTELTFGGSDKTYPNVKLGRNATEAIPDSPSGSTDAAAAFGVGAATEVTCQPSGVADLGGEFFVIPAGDLGSSRTDRIVGISMSRSGLIRKFRYDDTQPTGSRWKEF